MKTLLGLLMVIAIAIIILLGAVVLSSFIIDNAYGEEKPFASCPLEKWTAWSLEERQIAMLLVAEKFMEKNPNCERVYVEARGICCDVFFYAICEKGGGDGRKDTEI